MGQNVVGGTALPQTSPRLARLRLIFRCIFAAVGFGFLLLAVFFALATRLRNETVNGTLLFLLPFCAVSIVAWGRSNPRLGLAASIYLAACLALPAIIWPHDGFWGFLGMGLLLGVALALPCVALMAETRRSRTIA